MKRNGKGQLYSKSYLQRNQGRDIVSYAEMESDTLPEEDGLKISPQTYIDQETVSGKTTNNMFIASEKTSVTIPNKNKICVSVTENKRKSALERLGDKQKSRKESTSFGDSLKEISCVKEDAKTNSNELTSKEFNFSQSREKSTSKQLSDLHQRENYKKASSRISNADSRQIDENKNKNKCLKSQRDRHDPSNNSRHTKRLSFIKADHSDHQHDNYSRNNSLADIQVGGSNERGRSRFKTRDKCSPHNREISRITERDRWSRHDRGKARFNIRNRAIPDKRKQKSFKERHRSNLYGKRSCSKDKWRPCSNKRQNLCPNNSSQSDATQQSRQGKGPRYLQRKRLHSLDRHTSEFKRSRPERSADSHVHCSGIAESSRDMHCSVSAGNQMTHSESFGEMAAYGDIQHLDGNAQPKLFNYYGGKRLAKEQSFCSSHKLTYENRTIDRIALEETTRQSYQHDDPECTILQDCQNHKQLNSFAYDYNEHGSKGKQRSNENERNQCDPNENVPEDCFGDYVSILYSRETQNNVHKFSHMLPDQWHVRSYSNNSNFNMWQQNAKVLQNVSSCNKHVSDKRQRRGNIQNGLYRSITKIDLNILSEMNADDLAVYLSINHEDLDTFVWKTSNVENIDIFIQILGRVCESSFTVLVEKALYPIKERKFFERVDVKNMICELRRTKPESFDVDKFDILRNMLVLMNTLTEHLGCGPTELLNSLDSLQLCTTAMTEEEWETEASELIDNIRQKWDNPRLYFTHNDFTLSILPSLSEIETFQHSDVDNNYDNEAEYLERLFLVHRQDFVRPLCQGLVCLRNDLHRDRNCLDKKWRNDNIRVYKDVQLLTKCCSQQNGVTWRIRFDVTPYRKINWTSRKLLSYGSLVCLTDTTFSFIYFATVAERKPEDLTNGALEIKFINNQRIDIRLNYNLILVESQAFFPSYFHTLESLKTMHSQILNNKCRLPFGEHIVSSCVIVGKPEYFDSDVFKEDGLDVRCFDPGLESINKSDDLQLLPASSFGMDESQYLAFVNAITSKLSIIQGPPGTGKTVVGLKLAELLLQNTKIWQQDENKGPMLLLSYTNHALDQFLLEISKRIPTLGQQDIVRIGSRSELEALQKYNLSSHRSNRFTYNVVEMSTKNGSTRPKTNGEVANISKEVAFNAKTKLKDRIQEHTQLRTLRNMLLTGIVHQDWFFRIASVMIPRHYDALNEAGFIFWLCLPDLLGRSVNRKNQLNTENMYCEEDFEDFDIQRSPRDYYYDELEDDFCPNNHYCLDNNHRIPNLHLDFYKLRMIVSSEIIFSPVNSNFCKTYSDDKKRALLWAIEKKIASTINMPDEEVISVYDIWNLNYEDRWRLYKYWLQKALTPIEHEITKCEESFERANTRYKAVQQIADMNILQNAKLIACTTTRAARDIEILKRVAPTIIILEEAAEIPEHHVISCLTSSCQQLIMIGDQQQLRPSYNDYQTAREHKINISLFERLIQANFPYKRLNNQHRMRPEISKLLVPHIYASLNDDKSVQEYSNILGMKHNVYFISHDKFEDNDREDASKSHKNTHEALFIVELYRYLRLQGYADSNITILSPYLDQVRLLRTLIRRIDVKMAEKVSEPHFDLCDNTPVPVDKTTEQRKGVRITAVDNFQGEENDIILLSLVRSNARGIIGYLSEANRICVALSRAKKGMYVIGNLELLKTKSKVWEAILEDSSSRGLLGTSLQLSCQNHSTSTYVSTDNDFLLVQDGGCQYDCNFKRLCGHKCARKCHADDKNHNRERCIKLCNELCKGKLHRCQDECHYSKKCKPCKEMITKKIPKCQHDNLMPCNKDPNSASCTERCSVIISCGHRCQKRCTDPCSTEENCNELIKTKCPSGHELQVACYKKDDPPCKIPCNEILKCGHNCSGNCFECRRGRLHVPCKQKCDKNLVCGHICPENCNYTCPPCKAKCARSCGHQDKCQKPCGEPCIKCREPCNWKCCSKCPNGFVCGNLCHEPCDRPKCNTPCNRKLKKCGHTCPGLLCERKCINTCRVCEKEKLTEIFFGSEDEIGAVFIQLDDCKCVYEVSGLDTYIETKIEDLKKNEIVYLKCMKCSIKITNSSRYRNELRTLNTHINEVYNTLRSIEEGSNISSKKYHVLWLLKESEEYINEKDLKHFKNKTDRAKTVVQFNLIADQLTFLKEIKRLKDYASSINDNRVVQACLTELYNWVCLRRTRFAEQEHDEFALETRRLHLEIDIKKFIKDLTQHKNGSVRVPEEIQNHCQRLQSALKFTDSEISKMRKDLHNSVSNILGTSLQEKAMIKRAMEVELTGSGHWYTCSNGHYYCIGECGMPMEEIKCPYCNVTIGGTNHLLLDQNDRAMDMETLVTDDVL